MDIDYLLKHHDIQYGNLGENYKEYYERFRNCDVCETHIKALMNTLQNNDDDLVFLGGQTVRSFSMGHRQMRNPSFDIDVISPTEESIINLYKFAQDKNHLFIYNPNHKYFYMVLGGNPVSISPEKIYDIEIEKEDIINYENFRFIKPELLACLKLRRKPNGDHRHKDIVDIASLILSNRSGKITFDKTICLNYSEGLGNRYSIISPDLIDNIIQQPCYKKDELKVIKEYLSFT